MATKTTRIKSEEENKQSEKKSFLARYIGINEIRFLVIIGLIVLLIISGLLYYKINKLSGKIVYHDFRLYLLENTTKGFVDLTETKMQDIGDGFLAGGLSVEPHLTGVKVKGQIINSTSLTQETIKFKIEIAKQAKEFTINRISPGTGKKFEVYVPNVTIDKTNYATIKYIESMVGYMAR